MTGGAVGSYLEALADAIHVRCDYGPRALETFPQAAVSALEELPAVSRITSADVMDYILQGDCLPQQTQVRSDFAEPTVTLYRAEKFCIEVNFWIDSTTTIHQHAFAGAFSVLEGESVHSVWSFAQHAAPAPELMTGRLERRTTELLRTGDTRPIVPGCAFLHSLFHLTRPSATLVVRTDSSVMRADGPPWIYLAPGIAMDPFAQDHALEKQLEMLEFLRRTGADHAAVIDRLLRQDSLSCYGLMRLVEHAVERGASSRVCRQLARGAAERSRELAGTIVAATERMLHQRAIVRLRTKVQNEDGRRLLALMLLLDDLESIEAMLGDLGVTDTPKFLAEQVSELVGSVAEGRSGSADEIVILRLLFEGLDQEAAAEALRVQGCRAGEDAIRQTYALVLDTPIFKALAPSNLSAPQPAMA
jgi:hypothetical protein